MMQITKLMIEFFVYNNFDAKFLPPFDLITYFDSIFANTILTSDLKYPNRFKFS